MRKLASVQIITNLSPIPDADSIELAQVLGWKCVVKKDQFKVGESVIYVEYDSVLPEREEFEFLRNKNFRIKTLRLRGQISQGIIFPLSILDEGELDRTYTVGDDVTDILGIVKYEPPIKGNAAEIKGPFPEFISKTDETRIQAVPELLLEIPHPDYNQYYVTEKLDGTSTTFFSWSGGSLEHEAEFGVCSRNWELRNTPGSYHWHIANSLNLEEKLKPYYNIAIQGEIVGPGIQKNKYKLPKVEFFCFSIVDLSLRERCDLPEMVDFCKELGIKMVPLLDDSFQLYPNHTVDSLVELSRGVSQLNSKTIREGIVVRSIFPYRSNSLESSFSFKVINPDFLIKNGE
jgi:RNA ligase (TIGR02306 family)